MPSVNGVCLPIGLSFFNHPRGLLSFSLCMLCYHVDFVWMTVGLIPFDVMYHPFHNPKTVGSYPSICRLICHISRVAGQASVLGAE